MIPVERVPRAEPQLTLPKLLVLLLLAWPLTASAGTALTPGDLLLAAGDDGLLRIDPVTGDAEPFAVAAGFSPDDVIAAPSGAIYAAAYTDEKLFRVGADGAVSLLAEGVAGRLGLDPDERLIVSAPHGVFRVDPATGAPELLAFAKGTRIFTDAFGAAFTDAAEGGVERVDLRRRAGARASESRAGRSTRGVIVLPPYVPEPPVDVAVGSHRDLAWLETQTGSFTGFRRFDLVTRKELDLAAMGLPAGVWFDARSLAIGAGGEILAGGRFHGEPPYDDVALVEFTADGAFDRVLFTGAQLSSPDPAAAGWNVAVVPASEPPQAVDCSDALAPLLAPSVAVDARSALRCIERRARGQGSASSCVADALVAESGPERRIAAAERKRCVPGSTAAGAVGDAAGDAVASLLAGLFGDLDIALATRAGAPDTATCQKATATAATRCVRARLQSFERCRAPAWAADGPFLDGAAFAECFAQSGHTCDPTRIAPRLRRCAGVDVAAAFPACEAADASGLAICAAARAECAACRALEAVHGVPDACTEACPAAP